MGRPPDRNICGPGRLDRLAPSPKASTVGAHPSGPSITLLWLWPSARPPGVHIGAIKMLSLPTELWLLIGAYLSESDLLAAIQVNHAFHSQLTPLLYRNFVICGAQGGSAGLRCRRRARSSVPTPYVERSSATMERLEMIQSSSMLMGAIKSCTLCHFDRNLPIPNDKTTTDVLKQFLQEVVAFISTLPNCRDIVIDSVHISNRQLKQLISPHSRPANLSVRSLTILDGDSTHTSGSQHQCPLKNLTICGLNGSEQSVREFAEWSMSGDLQSFSAQSVTENNHSYLHSPLFHVQLLQKSFPNLRRLELVRDITSARVLACLPMLEELSLPYIPISPPLVVTPTILPRLSTFRGSGEQARSIVPGRPIRVLHVLVDFRGLLPTSVGDEAPNFGSTTSILELSVKTPTRQR